MSTLGARQTQPAVEPAFAIGTPEVGDEIVGGDEVGASTTIPRRSSWHGMPQGPESTEIRGFGTSRATMASAHGSAASIGLALKAKLGRRLSTLSTVSCWGRPSRRWRRPTRRCEHGCARWRTNGSMEPWMSGRARGGRRSGRAPALGEPAALCAARGVASAGQCRRTRHGRDESRLRPRAVHRVRRRHPARWARANDPCT